jgi:hypothetical protein
MKDSRELHRPMVGPCAAAAGGQAGDAASNTLAVCKGSITVFVTAPTPFATERSLMTQVLAKV